MLTEPPSSGKEAIDWILCMAGSYRQGGDGQKSIQNLAQELIKLLKANSSNGRHFGMVNGVDIATLLKGEYPGTGSYANDYKPIETLADGLLTLTGYSSGTITNQSNGIVKKDYESSYNSNFNAQRLQNSEDAAEIFLSFIPLLFFGLSFLYWKCKNGGWGSQKLGSGSGGLQKFLTDMGFSIDNLNESKNGSQVVGLFNVFHEFKNVRSKPTTYSGFLKNVKEVAESQFRTHTSNVPLYTLCLISFEYLATSTSLSTKELPVTQDAITTTLKELSVAVKSIQVYGLDELSSAYTKLSNEISKNLDAPATSEQSSVAGPIGGTVVTAGLLGGGSAVYFNVGNVGTLFKGFFNLH
ncbi:variant erythrocyte surface antigen-1 family protein [Babesia caballi]|uniref:Variant erythrocyte surface antigen-1 family protein n=1 Tax=Babesia caballi TaxID=5871 RepID=A0AAV4M0J3_BABCB|nr:variant erythrocyte surface antigen-1 family protein [Babesia caballi]